jgi:hypothetical protein
MLAPSATTLQPFFDQRARVAPADSSFWVAHGSATSQGTSQMRAGDVARRGAGALGVVADAAARSTSLISLSRSRSMPFSSTT